MEIDVSTANPGGAELLSYREPTQQDLSYIVSLAYHQIGIIPRRLKNHRNWMIYLNHQRIGFISYRRVDDDKNLYIYLLALEPEAQKRGYARDIVTWVITREVKESGLWLRDLKIRILKTNKAGISAALKSGYRVVSDLPRHYELCKKINYNDEGPQHGE